MIPGILSKQPKFLDLFAGFGGASKAFVDSGRWDVLRIDNNPLLSEVEHMDIKCVFEFRDWCRMNQSTIYESVDVIWASPPCYEFSLAYNAPRVIAARAGEDWNPSVELLEATLEIISILKPRYWVIENVRGSIKYFRDLLGEPMQIHESIVLWGNYPMFEPEPFPTKHQKDKRHAGELRANYRAEIPIEVSKALLDAVECQKTIFDY